MNISAVWLQREGDNLVVKCETKNGWIEVIRERDSDCAPISHICENSGLRTAYAEAAATRSYADLTASGGFAEGDR